MRSHNSSCIRLVLRLFLTFRDGQVSIVRHRRLLFSVFLFPPGPRLYSRSLSTHSHTNSRRRTAKTSCLYRAAYRFSLTIFCVPTSEMLWKTCAFFFAAGAQAATKRELHSIFVVSPLQVKITSSLAGVWARLCISSFFRERLLLLPLLLLHGTGAFLFSPRGSYLSVERKKKKHQYVLVNVWLFQKRPSKPKVCKKKNKVKIVHPKRKFLVLFSIIQEFLSKERGGDG